MENFLPYSFLLALLVLFGTSSQAQQDQPVCGYADIVDDYSNAKSNWFWGYHHYEVISGPICNTAQAGCTRGMVYNTLLSNASFGAPTEQTVPIVPCQTYQVAFFDWIPGQILGGRITVSLNQRLFSITNYTREGHSLHPGKVIRQIQQLNNGDIIINSSGSGIGKLPRLNEDKAPSLWNKVSDKLRVEVQKRLQAKGNYTLFDFPANTNGILKSESVVHPGDMVIIEVLTTASVGSFTEYVSAAGLAATGILESRQYYNKNKFANLNHGALVCSTGLNEYACIKNPFSNLLSDRQGRYGEADGVIFLAQEEGTITFELNDRLPKNNKGTFVIKITIVWDRGHGSRTVATALANYLIHK